MDRDSNVLKKSVFQTENVPKELRMEAETDYIVVERTEVNYNNKVTMEREIFSKEDEALWFFQKEDDKVFVKTYTPILWAV